MPVIEIISQFLLSGFAMFVIYKFIRSLRLVPNQYSFVVERLGNYNKSLGPGFHALIPFVDRVPYRLDLREETIEVEPQECFTKDNVKVEVDGVIYLSVLDPVNAAYGITNYRFAAVQLAQTTTRSIIGTMDLDQTFEERAYMSKAVVDVLVEMEQAWGIKVHRYEIKNIVTPRTVQKAMERQMTAERDKRAIVAKSEGLKESAINDAEGLKQEIINVSEGEMQSRINQAEGVAQKIEALAEATAISIEEIADAVSSEKGKEALQLQLAEKYIGVLSRLGRKENSIIIPTDITNYDAMIEGLGLNRLDE